MYKLHAPTVRELNSSEASLAVDFCCFGGGGLSMYLVHAAGAAFDSCWATVVLVLEKAGAQWKIFLGSWS